MIESNQMLERSVSIGNIGQKLLSKDALSKKNATPSIKFKIKSSDCLNKYEDYEDDDNKPMLLESESLESDGLFGDKDDG